MLSTVLHRDDGVGDRQVEAAALAGWLGAEERLLQLVPDVGRNAGAVVPHVDFHRLTGIDGGDLQRRLKPCVPAVARPP